MGHAHNGPNTAMGPVLDAHPCLRSFARNVDIGHARVQVDPAVLPLIFHNYSSCLSSTGKLAILVERHPVNGVAARRARAQGALEVSRSCYTEGGPRACPDRDPSRDAVKHSNCHLWTESQYLSPTILSWCLTGMCLSERPARKQTAQLNRAREHRNVGFTSASLRGCSLHISDSVHLVHPHWFDKAGHQVSSRSLLTVAEQDCLDLRVLALCCAKPQNSSGSYILSGSSSS